MEYDIIVIGGGPAGYPAAIEAVKQGRKTLLIEKAQLGGTCLNRGCIPTKCFCRSAEVALEVNNAIKFGIDTTPSEPVPQVMVLRKDMVVDELRDGVASALDGVDIIFGEARFTSPNEIAVGDSRFTAPKILIATGAEPAMLPIPGAELTIDSTELLSFHYPQIPESFVIIGGGVIGMEFASILNALGCRVTVVEYCKEILPGFDKDIAKRLRTALKSRGVDFVLQAAATEIFDDFDESTVGDEEAAAPTITVRYESKGKQGEVQAQQVLMAVGRKAVLPEGFEAVGGKLYSKGIEVDAATFETSLPGVYAIGDCNGICQLAHAATSQAMAVMGVPTALSPIPAAVFTVPEAAMVGATEEQLKEQGIEYRACKIPVRANGKALTMGAAEGLVKLLVSLPSEADGDPLDGQILGCHILGAHASDLIMEATLAMTNGLRAADLVRTIHPHPTLSELLPAALGR